MAWFGSNENHVTLTKGIQSFLRSVGMDEYYETFVTKGFDLETDLQFLTSTDLDELGITVPEHRRVLLAAAPLHRVSKDFQVYQWLRDSGLDYYFVSFVRSELVQFDELRNLELPDSDLYDELEITLAGHRKRLERAVQKLQKHQRTSADAEPAIMEGWWGKPPTLTEAKYDFLCVSATIGSTRRPWQCQTVDFMVDSGSDVTTLREEILDTLDLELLGPIQSRGVHASCTKNLYKARLQIGTEDLEIEVMGESYDSLGSRVFRHFRHYITGSKHVWLKGDYYDPSMAPCPGLPHAVGTDVLPNSSDLDTVEIGHKMLEVLPNSSDLDRVEMGHKMLEVLPNSSDLDTVEIGHKMLEVLPNSSDLDRVEMGHKMLEVLPNSSDLDRVEMGHKMLEVLPNSSDLDRVEIGHKMLEVLPNSSDLDTVEMGHNMLEESTHRCADEVRNKSTDVQYEDVLGHTCGTDASFVSMSSQKDIFSDSRLGDASASREVVEYHTSAFSLVSEVENNTRMSTSLVRNEVNVTSWLPEVENNETTSCSLEGDTKDVRSYSLKPENNDITSRAVEAGKKDTAICSVADGYKTLVLDENASEMNHDISNTDDKVLSVKSAKTTLGSNSECKNILSLGSSHTCDIKQYSELHSKRSAPPSSCHSVPAKSSRVVPSSPPSRRIDKSLQQTSGTHSLRQQDGKGTDERELQSRSPPLCVRRGSSEVCFQDCEVLDEGEELDSTQNYPSDSDNDGSEMSDSDNNGSEMSDVG